MKSKMNSIKTMISKKYELFKFKSDEYKKAESG